MKKLLLMFLIALASGKLFAQNGTSQAVPPPLPSRIVSGVVQDSTSTTLIGAVVKLKSTKDSLVTTTNEDGVFIFRDVKQASFTLTISMSSFRTQVKKMKNNDAVKNLVLDPITLKPDINELHEVVIKGKPSITYKVDTIEYNARDYHVRENATVDELLKKMEGTEVGSDGTVTNQGKQVVQAKINGKLFSGGDVATLVQNIPADIVDKVQFLNDYGDEAARTNVKDGDPKLTLNITTLANKSVGNMGRITAGGGNDDRYDTRLFAQRLDGNQQIGVIANFRNTVNGVASTGISGGSAGGAQAGGAAAGGTGGGGRTGAGSGSTSSTGSGSGGSGGTTETGGPSFNYRDNWGKKIQVNTSYTYNYNNVNSINSSYGDQLSTLGTTLFTNNSNAQNNSKTHNFSFEFEYTPDKYNFLRITPSFSYSGTESISNTSLYQTGLIHQDSKGLSSSTNNTPTYGGTVFYQHIFTKPRRNISLQLSLTGSDQQQNTEQNNHIIYYQDAGSTIAKDSLIHRYVDRGNITTNFRTSLTYVEPLTATTQLEFNSQVNYRGYNNNTTTSNISSSGINTPIDSLSNIYKYSFTETRIALNYRINQTKYNLSVGATAVPTMLDGTKISTNTTTHRTDLKMIPIFRFNYRWSSTQQFSINYSGTPTEPTFNEIQPVRDVSNPQNPVVGNPDLKPSFKHSINTQYNNYIANSKLNLSANMNTSITDNQIVTNIVQIRDVLNSLKNETRYVNLDGAYAFNGNYNIAKQLNDRRYNLSLNGNVTYSYNVAMSNNVQYTSTTWRYNERLGPRINPTDNIEVNPYVSYDWTRTFYTLPNTLNTDIKTAALNIDGKFYFGKTLMVGYSASKNYVSGISANLTRNPLVINATIEKEFFKARNGVLSLQAFDLLKQNNFTQQTITASGTTNTLSNALSRYFMLSFRLNLQKWSGTPSRNGKAMQRRGDGSFIEN